MADKGTFTAHDRPAGRARRKVHLALNQCDYPIKTRYGKQRKRSKGRK